MYESIIFVILIVLCVIVFLVGQLVHKQYTRKYTIYLLIMMGLFLIGYATTYSPNSGISLGIPCVILTTVLIFIILEYTKLF
jgi:hypothetical protein